MHHENKPNTTPPRNRLLPNWTPAHHLALYAQGYFPMADHTGRLDWYTADPRATLPLSPHQGLHTPRTIARILRKHRFHFTTDHAFERVIRACARPRTDHPDDIPWLTEPIIDACVHLHNLGYAHSIEAWRTDPDTNESHLAGGVYGLSLGSAFFAESMFHAPHPNPSLDGSNASAAALITLANHLHHLNYTLLDVQIQNPHTDRFGVTQTPIHTFLKQLSAATNQPDHWKPLPQATPTATINP